MFPILVDVFAELQVVNSWGYWRLPPPFEADVRFCECVWCVNARPGIDESSNCPADVFRCITPIWLLHSLFGDDSWSELSGILVHDYFFQLLSRGSREAHFFLSKRCDVSVERFSAATAIADSRYRSEELNAIRTSRTTRTFGLM